MACLISIRNRFFVISGRQRSVRTRDILEGFSKVLLSKIQPISFTTAVTLGRGIA